MADILDIPPERFQEEILNAEQLVLVNFYLSWEPRTAHKIKTLQRLAEEFSGRIKFVSVDLAKAPELDERYSLRSTPTMKLFFGGKDRATLKIFRPIEEFRAVLEFIIANDLANEP